ncbi:MAG: carbamoyltransferase N-terminal domain-containing protein, partial [Planctomycetota bacterium]
MTAFLGLSAFHRDAAAALVVDGRVVAAVQEERFSGKPGDASFPRRSVRWCLDEAGLRAGDLDGVVVSQKPLRTFERLLASHLEEFPRSARGFARAMFLWLGDRLWMRSRVAQELEVEAKRVLFCEHARAHAASAAFAAGLDDAAVLVLDDVGEWTTTAQCRVRAGAVEVLAEMRFPDSLGLVASAITRYLGFVPGQDEEVLGALGAHGAPRMLEHLRELVVPLDRGAFRVDRRAFPFRRGGDLAYGDALVEALGPARASGQPLLASGDDTRHADVAASAHALLAERAVDAARALRERVADVPDLALTGFLAQDARIVARVAEQSGFERVHAAPYADDAGAALGAALVGAQGAAFVGPLLGPRAEDDLGEHEGAKALDGADEVPRRIAERLARGELVGWARGRLALGRGALGGRIALASASEEGARARLL